MQNFNTLSSTLSNAWGNQTKQTKNAETPTQTIEEPDLDENYADDNAQGANAETLHEGLTSLVKEIRELKEEMKHDLATFKEEFKADFRQELNTFKEQMDRKLSANNKEIQEQKQKVEEAQLCIGELEEWRLKKSC